MDNIQIGPVNVCLLQGDITSLKADAVVNAANSSLMGGGGVDGAIHRVGGPTILSECKALRRTNFPDGLPVGEAVVTTAGNLPAQYVVHTVGPIWKGGNAKEKVQLANSYKNVLKRAQEKRVRSIAFPSISTGAYGFPIRIASGIALRTVVEFIRAFPDTFDEIIFVLFSQADLETYRQTLSQFKES